MNHRVVGVPTVAAVSAGMGFPMRLSVMETTSTWRSKSIFCLHRISRFDLVPELVARWCHFTEDRGEAKSPEYVASITRNYRQAIDSAISGQPVVFEPKQIEEMELTFPEDFLLGGFKDVITRCLSPATCKAWGITWQGMRYFKRRY